MRKRFAILAAPAALNMLIAVSPLRADSPDEISFQLAPNPKFAQCLEAGVCGPSWSSTMTEASAIRSLSCSTGRLHNIACRRRPDRA
jgi:hypothetical protein